MRFIYVLKTVTNFVFSHFCISHFIHCPLSATFQLHV